MGVLAMQYSVMRALTLAGPPSALSAINRRAGGNWISQREHVGDKWIHLGFAESEIHLPRVIVCAP